ncbi:MAG: metal ABC transporter substrate-binding protein [Clostridiales bacterium]
MKNKIILLGLTLVLALGLVACGSEKNKTAQDDQNSANQNHKLTAIATLFPQYDFAKIVGGDKVNVEKLLPNGVESHSYEPTPGDIVTINEADFFLYTGDVMEPWAATIIDGVSSDSLSVVDVSQDIPLLNHPAHPNHEAHEGEKTSVHEESADPHIWTDPTRAMIMVDNIAKAFGEKDPENAEYYQENAKNYKAQLSDLDNEIKTIIAEGERNKIIFGGRFAFLYFCDHYGLEHDAAYDSCSDSGEPSAKKVSELIDEIKTENIPIIFYEELRTPTVAQSIGEETGAKLLLLHSCHNVTEAELKDGISYLQIMEQNAANLKEGLN